MTNPARFTVTFETITPESAEYGDAAERGFASPHGWQHSDPAALTLREALSACQTSVGAFVDSGRWFTTIDAADDYATGANTVYSIHPPFNITRSSYARLSRLLCSRRWF